MGKWNIKGARPIIRSRWNNDKSKTSSIKALGYYNDNTCRKSLKSEYFGVRTGAKKITDKLSNL